jgi:hypothetical protein
MGRRYGLIERVKIDIGEESTRARESAVKTISIAS